ncbi:hypothetical protein KIN20_035418 [Parelaphostrongylus tenuis]|uniref:Uncharacterized protein n=1 Tax=Parelaphostrongylus tenuis TaxID=148309 RepID=A0AAD5RBE6_PARTN|nr:hypothetical protein KIN20_035418 [Parelaphostrongylus tenuis]
MRPRTWVTSRISGSFVPAALQCSSYRSCCRNLSNSTRREHAPNRRRAKHRARQVDELPSDPTTGRLLLMDSGAQKFRIGVEEPAAFIAVDCAQIAAVRTKRAEAAAVESSENVAKMSMDGVLKFRIGVEEPAVFISVDCAQIASLTDSSVAQKQDGPDFVSIVKTRKRSTDPSSLQPPSKISSVASSSPSSSRRANGFANVENRAPQRELRNSSNSSSYDHFAQPCRQCGCKRVRIVNPGRTDGRNIMECTSANCLATIKLTNLPAGTLIHPGVKPEEFSWYDLDPGEIFYPSDTTIKRLEDSLKSVAKKQPPRVGYDHNGYFVVRCPGQKKLVKLL